MKKIILFFGAIILLSCSNKEEELPQKEITFQEVKSEVLTLADKQNFYLLSNIRELKKSENAEDFIAPDLKKDRNFTEIQIQVVENTILKKPEKDINLKQIVNEFEKLNTSEYTKNVLKQVFEFYETTHFIGDYSVIDNLKTDNALKNIPIEEKEMLFQLYAVCDILKDANPAGKTSFYIRKCSIDGERVLEAFLVGTLAGGGPQAGLIGAIISIGVQGVFCEGRK